MIDRRSLRLRLVASYLALSLLLLTISGFVFSAVLAAYADQLHRQRAVGYFNQVQAIMADAGAAGAPPEEVLSLLQRQLPELQPELIGIRGPETDLPFPPPRNRLMLVSLAAEPLAEDVTWTVGLSAGRGAPFLFRFTLAAQPGATLRSLMVQVAVVLALAFALAGLVGWWLSRWLSRPLSRLADATASVAGGDFQQTVEPTGVSELDGLVTQFNRMVLALRESFRTLTAERDVAKRFAADAAHELKTPVAALRAYQDVVTRNPDRLAQALPAMDRQVERMEGIISGLLEIAALAEGTGATLIPVDAGEVIAGLVPGWQAMAEEYSHTLAVERPAGALPVRLDPRLLEVAVTNLVDNACKYTPAGAEIHLVLRREGQEAVISVADPGPGIPAEEFPFIFERFHRGVDTQAIPGNGLGLAIVRESAARLGGTVTAASEPGRGSRFDIRLPIAGN